MKKTEPQRCIKNHQANQHTRNNNVKKRKERIFEGHKFDEKKFTSRG